MRAMSYCTALILLAMCLLSHGESSNSGVPLTAEPHHHLALENAYTRVFKVEVAPQSSTLMHRHDRDYLFVNLGAVELENDVLGKDPVHTKLADGQVTYTAGGFSHIARNLSQRPFRNVTVEVIRPAAAGAGYPRERERGVELGAGVVTDIVLDNAALRATEVRLNPGGTLPARHLGPHLVVAVTALDVRSELQGQSKELHLKTGDVSWGQAGLTGSAVNIGSAAATLIEIEFK